jgi:hypothetical protein
VSTNSAAQKLPSDLLEQNLFALGFVGDRKSLSPDGSGSGRYARTLQVVRNPGILTMVFEWNLLTISAEKNRHSNQPAPVSGLTA